MQTTLKIPYNARIMVSEGQRVEKGDILFKVKDSSEEIVALSSLMKIKPDKIIEYLVKKLGDDVQEKELVAIKKTLLSDIMYYADYAGTLTDIDTIHGTITISKQKDYTVVNKSPIDGTISKITHDSITVSTKPNHTIALIEVSHDMEGELFVYTSDASFDIDDVQNKIIVCDGLSITDKLKLEALGIQGIMSMRSIFTEVAYAKISEHAYKELIKLNGHTIYISALDKQALVYA